VGPALGGRSGCIKGDLLRGQYAQSSEFTEADAIAVQEGGKQRRPE
jgi:hypothetical protein